MLTSTMISGFDPRGVRYTARLTRVKSGWLVEVETLPSERFVGSFIDAVSHTEMSLNHAIRSGAKPAPDAM